MYSDALNVGLAFRFIEVSEEGKTTALRGLVDRWMVRDSDGGVDAVPGMSAQQYTGTNVRTQADNQRSPVR